MLDLKWHDAPAQKKPANDNTYLRNALERSVHANAWQMPKSSQKTDRSRAHGRAVDITALIAALLWQFSFLVLLFVLV